MGHAECAGDETLLLCGVGYYRRSSVETVYLQSGVASVTPHTKLVGQSRHRQNRSILSLFGNLLHGSFRTFLATGVGYSLHRRRDQTGRVTSKDVLEIPNPNPEGVVTTHFSPAA